jgi:hypothetical protein
MYQSPAGAAGRVAGRAAAVHHARVDTTLTRFLSIAIALLLVGGVVAAVNHGNPSSVTLPSPGGTSTPTPLPTASRGTIRCPPGPRAAIPKWYPKDLSLPRGTYALDIPLPKVSTYRRVALAVPTSIKDFARHIATRWPAAGWVFTHAEVEFTDAEAQVTKASGDVAAAFVARSICNDSFVQMYLTYGSIAAPRSRPSR